MISIRVVHFGSLGPVRRKKHFLLWNTGKLDFFKVAGNSWNHLFYDEFDVCSTFCKFQHFVDICFTKISIPEVYPLRFSGIQRKMHFLKVALNCSSNWFYGDFRPCSIFFKFCPVRWKSHLSLLWVTRTVDFPKLSRNSWNHPFYDDFDVCSTFCKF